MYTWTPHTCAHMHAPTCTCISINTHTHTHTQLSLPDGAFDCWAYMTCNEAIQAMMMRISADSLVSATSSLLLVRAELWQYALQKVGPSSIALFFSDLSPWFPIAL